MKAKIVIIGGGVAGLSAAIRLLELGEKPLLIEKESCAVHKICGEFLSPECLAYLNNWKIFPTPISKVILKTESENLRFAFPSPAGGFSHMTLDPSLLNRALDRGANLISGVTVVSIEPKQSREGCHFIKLTNGECLEASHLIIATGRIPGFSTQAPPMAYLGFKAHFKNIFSNDLEMFLFKNAYLGIAPIENDQFNIAGLIRIRNREELKDPQEIIEQQISRNVELSHKLGQAKNLFGGWMTNFLPEFGIRQTPDWLDTYFIGDAAISIPPACGGGLALGIVGGCLAAEYAMRGEAEKFKKMWKSRCRYQMFWAKQLHRLMLNPKSANFFFKVAKRIPFLSKVAFNLTRQFSI